MCFLRITLTAICGRHEGRKGGRLPSPRNPLKAAGSLDRLLKYKRQRVGYGRVGQTKAGCEAPQRAWAAACMSASSRAPRHFCAEQSCSTLKPIAPRKSAPSKFAPSKLVSLTTAPVSTAPRKSAFLKLASRKMPPLSRSEEL